METITVADDEIDEAVQFRKDYRKTIIEFSNKRVDKEYQEHFIIVQDLRAERYLRYAARVTGATSETLENLNILSDWLFILYL